MTAIAYTGEHLVWGNLGQIGILLAFGAALFAAFGFWRGTLKGDEVLVQWARKAFFIHTFAVVAVCGILLALLFLGYTEYDYVWKHSNSSMPMRYLLSCFWEGQEGSFLLWTFWHAILGSFTLLFTDKTWAHRMMWVVAAVQVVLMSMVLGIYIGDIRIGSDPFILVRNLAENAGLPWTRLPNYLEVIPAFVDGRGLNPLLQNYWMTIHPPTLFLGFASTLFPFALIVSGFQFNAIQQAFKKVLPWCFFSVGVFGLGILMGGAWAYEALSFGGFWAWDPVENASLVPWLFMLAGSHMALIAKHRKKYYFTSALLLLLGFIFVLYSTFLTRSGILGDTSVHSFTGNGMIAQLLFYLLAFTALGFTFLSKKKKIRNIYHAGNLLWIVLALIGLEPEIAIALFVSWTFLYLVQVYFTQYRSSEDDSIWSREFWMFIGSMVITLSALQITISTSIPVFNALMKPYSAVMTQWGNAWGWNFLLEMGKAGFAPPSDAIAHYNKWQIPFAVIICLLVAFSQFFAYKKSKWSTMGSRIWGASILGMVATSAWLLLTDFQWSNPGWILLLFTSILSVVGNAYYWSKTGSSWRKSGGAIAHIGFGLLVLGAFVSTSQSETISSNTTGWDIRQLSEDFKNDEDVLLFKGDTTEMDAYYISFVGKKVTDGKVKYAIDYWHKAPKSYAKGDVVIWEGMFFQCMESHTSNGNFIEEQPKVWRMLEPGETEKIQTPSIWTGFQRGEKAFQLEPQIQLNPTFGNVPEPDTKHGIWTDLYTHVRWAELEEVTADEDGYKPAAEYTISVGDTLFFSNKFAVFQGVGAVEDKAGNGLLDSDLAAFARLLVHRETTDSIKVLEPLFILRDSTLVVPDVVEDTELGLKVKIENILPETKQVVFQVSEHKTATKEFIVMQALMFPGINFLWLGCIIMVLGCLIAVWNRKSEKE